SSGNNPPPPPSTSSSSMGGPAVSSYPPLSTSSSHPSTAVPVVGPSHSPKKEDSQVYSRSWKLRKALQSRESELQKESTIHPDERHIVRVSQNEEKPSSRPPSHPASHPADTENG